MLWFDLLTRCSEGQKLQYSFQDHIKKSGWTT
jgi:hypothetical protein